jgi:hypothetical protein
VRKALPPSPFSTGRELRRLGFSKKEIARVEAKARGAAAGRRGYHYEDLFATASLTDGCRRAMQRGGPEHGIAEPTGAFVDDIIIRAGDLFVFHQLKTGKDTWTGSRGALAADFRNQARVCEAKGLLYGLVLVVPDEARRDALDRNMPNGLRRTTVEVFPIVERLTDLPQAVKGLRRELDGFIAFAKPGRAAREHVLQAIHAAWMDRRVRTEFLEAAALLRALRANHLLFVARPFRDTSMIWRRAKAIIERIPGLSVTVDQGYFCYDYRGGLMQGHEIRCVFRPCRSPVPDDADHLFRQRRSPGA